MVSAIFKPEVSALESQVAALQAQIVAHIERISQLNEAEAVASDSLEALKATIQKVAGLAPDAIATLKTAVFSLFNDGGNSGGNDNQPTPPTPAPQPGFDNRTLHEKGALDACREYAQEQQAIAPQPEPLTGQSTEFASLLASPLCCHLEDCPSHTLTGQSVEIACVISDAPQPQTYVELIPLNHLVAYQRRQDGEIICCYVGGNNKNRLKDWGSWLCTQHSVGSGFEVREAVRLTAYRHELKIWSMSLSQIQRLAQEDTTKTPPSRYHVASQPVAERLLAKEVESAPHIVDLVEGEVEREVEAVLATEAKLEQVPSPDPRMFQVGSRVEVTSDRHGVELVGQSGVITAGTSVGAAVDVGGTLRWFCSDELAPAISPESPAIQEPTEEERVAIASIQPPAPTLPAARYNPYPQGRRGAVSNYQAYQAAKAVEREQKALAATASTTDAIA